MLRASRIYDRLSPGKRHHAKSLILVRIAELIEEARCAASDSRKWVELEHTPPRGTPLVLGDLPEDERWDDGGDDDTAQ